MQELSDNVPPTMRRRMDTLGINSVRKLERQMNVSNATLKHYLSSDKASIRRLVSLLEALGYTCSSPEFDLIKELCGEKDLKGVDQSSTLSSVKKQQSGRAQKERILYLMFHETMCA